MVGLFLAKIGTVYPSSYIMKIAGRLKAKEKAASLWGSGLIVSLCGERVRS